LPGAGRRKGRETRFFLLSQISNEQSLIQTFRLEKKGQVLSCYKVGEGSFNLLEEEGKEPGGITGSATSSHKEGGRQ